MSEKNLKKNVQAGIKVQTNVRAGDAVEDFANNVLGWPVEYSKEAGWWDGPGGEREMIEAWMNM